MRKIENFLLVILILLSFVSCTNNKEKIIDKNIMTDAKNADLQLDFETKYLAEIVKK